MKINYRDPIWALAVIALILLFANQCQQKRSYEQSQTVTLNRVQQLSADTARLHAELRTLRAVSDTLAKESARRMAQDSIQHRADMAEKRLYSKKLAEARKDIQPIIDTSAVVKRYVELSDSTIAQRDSTIAHQEVALKAQQIDYANQIKELGKQVVKEVELADTWQRFAEKQSKDLAKADRAKRRWRGVAITATTVAVALGLTAAQ